MVLTSVTENFNAESRSTPHELGLEAGTFTWMHEFQIQVPEFLVSEAVEKGKQLLHEMSKSTKGINEKVNGETHA
jgi:hypothetical protein